MQMRMYACMVCNHKLCESIPFMPRIKSLVKSGWQSSLGNGSQRPIVPFSPGEEIFHFIPNE